MEESRCWRRRHFVQHQTDRHHRNLLLSLEKKTVATGSNKVTVVRYYYPQTHHKKNPPQEEEVVAGEIRICSCSSLFLYYRTATASKQNSCNRLDDDDNDGSRFTHERKTQPNFPTHEFLPLLSPETIARLGEKKFENDRKGKKTIPRRRRTPQPQQPVKTTSVRFELITPPRARLLFCHPSSH